jgi:NhaA family Na+:H+ antiporter
MNHKSSETTLGMRLVERGRHLASAPWAGGAILVIFVIVALVLANLEATKAIYHHILTTPLTFAIGEGGEVFNFSLNIEKFINDGLMVVFFFVVGLEIKRELLFGRLSSIKQAMLPIVAAVGGMVVPAVIYAVFNAGGEFASGWGIPMATDIAFAIAILSLMGDKVPVSLKVFLTALAIVDDLGAIVVIAIFYTYKINWLCLALIAVLILMLWLLRRRGVTRIAPYLITAVVVWFLFYRSGVHATISGVIMAMMIPSAPRLSKKVFLYRQKQLAEEFRFHDHEGVEVLMNEHQHHALLEMRRTATDAIGMSQRMEHLLHPWITFLIMPIFALANSGVEINSESMGVFATSLGWGILGGLVLGKPIGIFLASWLAVRFKIAVLPRGAHWIPLLGVACVGGIGFTMSIFIDTLAFADAPAVARQAKIVILAASAFAGLLGFGVINVFHTLRNVNKSKYLRRYAHNLTKNG